MRRTDREAKKSSAVRGLSEESFVLLETSSGRCRVGEYDPNKGVCQNKHVRICAKSFVQSKLRSVMCKNGTICIFGHLAVDGWVSHNRD